MTGTQAVIFLLVVGLVAIGLDLLVLWIWREYRKARAASSTGRRRRPTLAAATADRMVNGWLAIEAAAVAAWAVVRRLRRRSARMLQDEQTLLRTLVVLACFLTALGLGYVSSDQFMVAPWLPWAWIACVAVSLVALLPIGRPQFKLDQKDRWVFGVLAVALLLRVLWLERIPGRFHVDEWGDAEFTLRYVVPPLDRTISPFVTGHSAQPSLYFYLARTSMAVFGERIAGLRMTSIVGGSLAVLATFALVSLLHNRTAAYIAAALMATSHFHIHWSRIGLNNIWDTLWVPLILALFAWGWKRNRLAGSTLAGLALGLSQYFYAGSRIGIFLLAYFVIRLWREKQDDARLIRHGGRLIGLAAVVAAPLAVFAVLNPEVFFDRLSSGLLWKPPALESIGGAPSYIPTVGQQLIWTLLSFTAIPEGAGFYRPGAPLVIGLAVPLLLAGVLWQVHRREWTPVLWLALTMFFGGFLLEALPASNHYVVAVPAICWLVASPLEALIGFGRLRWALVAIAILIATDLYFYFGIFAQAGSLDFVHPFPPYPYG